MTVITSKVSETKSRDDEVEVVQLSNETKPNLAIVKNTTKNHEHHPDPIAALLPMVSNLTSTIINIGDMLKNSFVSNGIQLITPASTPLIVKPAIANIHQSTTECQSKSSTSCEGITSIAKGFAIGGLTTILLLLSLSMAMKIAQPINEVNLMNAHPIDVIEEHVAPVSIQHEPYHLPTIIPTIEPFPPISTTAPTIIRPKYVITVQNGPRKNNSQKPRKIMVKTINNSRPVKRIGESDEISQMYE
ncbi:hypothetical protein PV325_010619 [Microctonus aethiopoides]|nr:hypothetical protein PV325_010619 [Microctonus aethiopoides]KAK0093104.1 hypothetical protein PV326_014291 [Microctonus aethiopoides]